MMPPAEEKARPRGLEGVLLSLGRAFLDLLFPPRCGGWEADVYYGVVRQEDLQGRLPGARTTCVRVREGGFLVLPPLLGRSLVGPVPCVWAVRDADLPGGVLPILRCAASVAHLYPFRHLF